MRRENRIIWAGAEVPVGQQEPDGWSGIERRCRQNPIIIGCRLGCSLQHQGLGRATRTYFIPEISAAGRLMVEYKPPLRLPVHTVKWRGVPVGQSLSHSFSFCVREDKSCPWGHAVGQEINRAVPGALGGRHMLFCLLNILNTSLRSLWILPGDASGSYSHWTFH